LRIYNRTSPLQQQQQNSSGRANTPSNPPLIQTRGSRKRDEAAKRSKAPLVSKENAQSLSKSDSGGEKTSRKRKSIPERYQGAPDWEKNVIQAPYQHQQGEAGASGVKTAGAKATATAKTEATPSGPNG